MTDANQSFSLSEARRRARVLKQFDIAWFEEPLPADDVGGHQHLALFNNFVLISIHEINKGCFDIGYLILYVE